MPLTSNNEYTLEPDERLLLDEIAAQIAALQQQAQGALRAIAQIRKLEGQWSYDSGILRRAKGTGELSGQ